MYEIKILLESIWFLLKQISPYWASGLIAGSLVSVFLSNKITGKMAALAEGRFWLLPLSAASILGIVSPLCMYGTVPTIAAFGKKGISQHLLSAFMVSSILLNPNILLLSFALGIPLALARLGLSFLSGVLAGVLVFFFFRNRKLFSLERFASQEDKPKKVFIYDLFKAFRITAPYLLIGITISALFDRYIPPDWVSAMFGAKRGLGVLFAATLSIPLYACGGGTIPLIKMWLHAGMGAGDAMAFMLAGPALKINNLSAVKMILGTKNFIVYIVYSIVFAFLAGLFINVILKQG
ncbi:MAG: permease [Treponema sp.]|nr:permease [Treponema sp.]